MDNSGNEAKNSSGVEHESPSPANISDLLPTTKTGHICECQCHGYHEVRSASCVHCEESQARALIDQQHDFPPLNNSVLEDYSEGATGCLDDGDELSQVLRGVSQQDLTKMLDKHLKTNKKQ